MGLITLLLIVAFTALYLSKSMEKKPEVLVKVVDQMVAHIDQVALWSAMYGAAAAVLTLLLRYSSADMLIRLAANVVIVVMTLPYIFDKLSAKYRGQVNAAILEEAQKIVTWTRTQDKMVGYIGAVLSLLLFATIFK